MLININILESFKLKLKYRKLSRSAAELVPDVLCCLLRNALSPSSEPVTHTRPHSLPALVTSHPCAHWPSAEFFLIVRRQNRKENWNWFKINFKRERFLILFWNFEKKNNDLKMSVAMKIKRVKVRIINVFIIYNHFLRWTALPNCQKTPLKLPEEPCSPLPPAEPRSSTTGIFSSTSSIRQLLR